MEATAAAVASTTFKQGTETGGGSGSVSRFRLKYRPLNFQQNLHNISPFKLRMRSKDMSTQNQRRIKELLEADAAGIDRSLRGQALRRATAKSPPRTLTAWEWEQWYEQHGVPDTHRVPAGQRPQRGGFRALLCRLLSKVRAGTADRS
jgi:hypothetical protein